MQTVNKESERGMIRKTTVAFLITFVVSYAVIKGFFYTLTLRQERIDYDQSTIIQENVRDRFVLFLELPLSVGFILSDYLNHVDITKEDYGVFITKLLKFNKDILGINLVNHQGEIIRVYPVDANSNAKGRVSQNFSSLKKSFAEKEKYWLSPPFKLFQGQQGFVFYLPIMNGESVKGWIAPVISTDLFDEKFKLAEFLKTYDVIIQDVETGLPYFETGIEPQNKTKVYETESEIYGRKVRVLSWRKTPIPLLQFPWYFSFIVAIFLSLLAVLIMKLYEQRKKARNQLQDIGTVLQLTSKEALSKLIDLQNDYFKESPENINYITNLIEQIDLLQTMADTGEGLVAERHKILPLLEKVIESLNDISAKKALSIKYNRAHLQDVEVVANAWLMQNTVICNILTHSIIFADSGTGIVIDYKKTEDTQFITFRTENVHQNRPDTTPITSDRRIEVARKVLQIYEGDLFLQNDLGGGLIIRIVFPLR